MRKRLAFVFLAGLTVAATALTTARPLPLDGGGTPPAEQVQVSIDNFSFAPGALNVRAGTTVTWTNKDDIPHTVVSNDQLFASPVLDTDGRFSYTFKDAGSFGYYCSIHPKMTAKIVVK